MENKHIESLIKWANINKIPENAGGFELYDDEGKVYCGFPRDKEKIKNMKVLNLQRFNLKELPEEICFLENLEYINVANNNLTTLPKKIGNLKKIKEINIDENNFTALLEELKDLKLLKAITITNNKFIVFPKVLMSPLSAAVWVSAGPPSPSIYIAPGIANWLVINSVLSPIPAALLQVPADWPLWSALIAHKFLNPPLTPVLVFIVQERAPLLKSSL